MSDSKFDPVTDRIIVNLDRIHLKLDVLNARLDSIDKTLVRNAADIEYHIVRSDRNEQLIEMVRLEMKPLKERFVMVNGGLRLFAGITGVAALVAALLKIMGVIR
jgi:hypothetical protein